MTNDEQPLATWQDERSLILDEHWRSCVPTRFVDANVDQLDPTVADAVRHWLDDVSPRPNLLFVGPVGVGKTHAALAVARELHYRDERWTFLPVVELLADLRPDGDERAERQCDYADTLILDDVGGERSTDWVVEQLYRLINRRWLDRRAIIATTNIPTEKLASGTGERIVSRLMGGALVIELTGKDRRY